MKTILLLALLLLINNKVINAQWYIGSTWNSSKVTPCHADATFEIDVAEDEELDIIVLDGTSLSKIKNIKTYKSKDKIDVSGWKKGEYILHIYHRGELVKKDRLIVE